MAFFDIDGYEPVWLSGLSTIRAAHGDRLRGLVGRRLRHVHLTWFVEYDEWLEDAPVVVDFGDERLEIRHFKFDDLSLTWNTIDPYGKANWPWGDPAEPSPLRWRHDVHPELSALEGQELLGVELLECVTRDMAGGMVALGFVFPNGRFTVFNAMDENGIEFTEPGPDFRVFRV
ncbi:hypothetical protein [Amycolatopsis regifaucium]|uniref:Uncharacterized protein n=1 Tax=Amycolatopsis regifaucium TaxID=546365 RepID=A0A154M459_9PSEU|nr:hypothetical protein [Amycolatopsis regifaucium]KZB79405.1 hypothetical protein AVL48_17635 [Amycolatopsis regifaucium]OKA07586.1 hypothetical protein ATP06_0217320 [Amycolatopsis regifaucium]SFH07711.1 hypothetical protein SAMN04489731_102349 [Amycolatopsis regifaucium]